MKYILLFLVSSLSFISCYENVDNSIQTTYNEEDDHFIDTKITGALIGNDGNPISGYTLIVNNNSFEIINKFFLLELEDVKKYGQEIRCIKDGMEIGFGNVMLVEDNLNRITLYTTPTSTITSANTDNPSSINLFNNDVLKIPSLALKKDNNETFYGSYDINHVTSSGSSSSLHISGQRAFGQYAQRLAIEITRLYDFSISDSGNEELSISNDGGVELEIDLNSGGRNLALFKYHEDQQRWKWNSSHESMVTNHPIHSNGKYALAYYEEGVYMEGTFTKEDIAITYQKMEWSSSSFDIYSQTTLEGKWNTILPKNQTFQLDYRTSCEDIISGTSKSTTGENKSDVIVTTSNSRFYNLGTQVFNCQKEIVDQVNVVLTQDNDQHVIISDKALLSGWVSICPGPFEVAAYDISNDMKGPGIEWTLGSGDQAAYLPLCDQYPDGYSFIRIKEDYKIFDPFEFSFDGQMTTLTATSGTVNFQFTGSTSGHYDEEQIHILVNDMNFGQDGYFISCQSSPVGCGINDCTVSHYEVSGGWLRVSFSGDLWMQTIDPPKAGYFPVDGVIVCKTK